MAKTPIPCTSVTKSVNTYPKSNFTFGTDKNGKQILVANPTKAIMNPVGNNPDRMPYNLTIVVAIDSGYTGTPKLYYDSSKFAFFVEFDYPHSTIPETLHKWTLIVTNGDGRILTGPNQPKAFLTDTIVSSSHILIEGEGTETSDGTEVTPSPPPIDPNK